MKVGIYTNLKKAQALEVTKNLIACFNLHSVDYYLYKSFEGKIEGKYFSFENFDFDIMFALGGDGTILKLANNKQTRLEQDFKTNIIKYGPSCNIIIDNRKDIQHILIENISTSFTDTKTVASILKETFNAYLKQHHLHIEIDKEFQQSEFWNIVDAHPLEITLVRFYFKYPNLPRALTSVNELLASTSKATNSKETILQIKSNDSEQLELSQDNNELNSLVKASADSGSIITLKIKGYNKHIHTGRTSKTVEIDSIELAAEEDIFNQAIDKVVSTLNSLK